MRLAPREPCEYREPVDQAGLNADELEQLRRWGAGLQQDSRLEVSAAGRAIVLLIDEIERLHVLVWDHRLYPPDDEDLPVTLAQRGEQQVHPLGLEADDGLIVDPRIGLGGCSPSLTRLWPISTSRRCSRCCCRGSVT